MPRKMLLTLNAGSSSIKLGMFALAEGHARSFGRGSVDLRRQPLRLTMEEGSHSLDVNLEKTAAEDLHEVIDEMLGWLARHFADDRLTAVAHRIVHGGDRFAGPVLIDDEAIKAMETLAPLAPLHQPQGLRLIRAIRRLHAELPQVASFDTAFHRTQSDRVRRFALPRALFDQGIKRYGFHGISYKFIASRLCASNPDLARGRVVIAHLGSGASVCGLSNALSVDTSMSFSTLDGVPMSTRSGALDPGVVLYLVKTLGMSAVEVEDLLYHRSGLIGLSGISADIRELIDSTADEAREALEIFALRVAREVAAIATTLGGLDAIVFTGGIGEHQPVIREAIVSHLAWLGAALDADANQAHRVRIEARSSRVAVLVMRTDEEQVIAEEACEVLFRPPK